MKTLITGGSGFIGQHLFQTLLRNGHDAWAMDMALPPASGYGQEKFLGCDLLDGEQVRDTVDSIAPDAVVHLAARTDLKGADPEAYAVNTLGTRNLIAAMAAARSVQRCIFTSTQLVHPLGHTPANDGEHCPTTPYGESKAAMERLIRETHGGVPAWCIVRPTTVWGPGMQEHYVRFLRMIRRGTYFHVGKRPLRKSYGYVGNVAHQYRMLLETPAAAMHERVFYLADYRPVTLQDWTDGLQRAVGAKPIPTLPKSFARLAAMAGDAINLMGLKEFPFNSFRLGNVLAEPVYDLSATEEVCGELPWTLEQGIEATVRWFLSLEKPAPSNEEAPWIKAVKGLIRMSGGGGGSKDKADGKNRGAADLEERGTSAPRRDRRS